MAEPARLFLDTARLGPMSPSAQLAARDFARLAGEGLSTLYFEEFLTRGSARFSRSFRRQFPGLSEWTGLGGLRRFLRRLTGAPSNSPVLFASRGAPLFRLAADWLASRCRNVFTTDTLWPPYRAAVEEIAGRANVRLTVAPVRNAVLSGQISATQLVRELVATFVRNRCDGLVLSVVSHDGVRIPTTKTLTAITAARPIRAAVIDGAQELAHVPVDLSAGACDFYLAGCHKWLGAYQPLAVAILSNTVSAPAILGGLRQDCPLDPLLQLLHRVERLSVADSQETVNVTPLLSAWGALYDFFRNGSTQRQRFRTRITNAAHLSSVLPSCGWSPLLPSPGLRTGLLMAQAVSPSVRALPPLTLQQRLDASRTALTAYADGTIRLALPDRSLRVTEWNLLEDSLAAVAANGRAPPTRTPRVTDQQVPAPVESIRAIELQATGA